VTELSPTATPAFTGTADAPRRDERELGRDELAVLLAINRAIGRHLHRDELFGALATCLRDVVPTQRFGIELPIAGDQLQGHLLTPRGTGEQPTEPTVLPASGTACDWVLRNREWIVTARRDELRERFPVTFGVMEGAGAESLCALPLVVGQSCRAALFFMAAAPGAYTNLPRALLEQIASAVAVALDDCLAHEEVRRLRDQLAAENVYLQDEIREEHNFSEIVGSGPELRRVMDLVARVAPTGATVLLLGETGTGKELVARAIHARSRRKDKVLVKVNCAAIPVGLIESELFGHERGAFTGAVGRKVGRYELADGGTIFLDEIGELPLDLQPKLLRVLEEGEFDRVGGTRTFTVDVRVIAATNRNLEAECRNGRFRPDLFYRLNVFPITVPPLRERREDIPALVAHFVQKDATKLGKRIERVPAQVMAALAAYAWPGNVRELEHVVERAMIVSDGPELTAADWLPKPHATSSPTQVATLVDVERGHILNVLEATGWRVSGSGGAADLLGLPPTTLESRMKKLGIGRQR
jgi:formate hydrogenlyase transcriptional activator